MNTLLQSKAFTTWLRRLRDTKGRARILARLDAAELGHFGDIASVGSGVFEMRIHFGPGYRLYYTQHGTFLYLLLPGGDKSTQKRDIRRAIEMATSFSED
jgi:putative addiction module killer protein